MSFAQVVTLVSAPNVPNGTTVRDMVLVLVEDSSPDHVTFVVDPSVDLYESEGNPAIAQVQIVSATDDTRKVRLSRAEPERRFAV